MKRKEINYGQTLVEFALILPILLLLVLGFFDLGRAVFYYSSLSNAVREGTRDGVVMMNCTRDTKDEDDIKDNILGYAFGLTGTSNPLTKDDIYFNYPYPPAAGGIFTQQIEITATYCFKPVTPGINLLLDTTCDDGSKGIELTAVSLMWMEPCNTSP